MTVDFKHKERMIRISEASEHHSNAALILLSALKNLSKTGSNTFDNIEKFEDIIRGNKR